MDLNLDPGGENLKIITEKKKEIVNNCFFFLNNLNRNPIVRTDGGELQHFIRIFLTKFKSHTAVL